MPTTLELIQTRAKLLGDMKEAVKKGDAARAKGDAATEYDAEFDKAETEERDLSKQIARQQRLDELAKEEAEKHLEIIDKRDGQPGPSNSNETEYREAFRTWFRDGDLALSNEQRAILKEVRGTSTQVVGTSALGGYTVPTGFLAELITAMKDYSGIAQVARILPTDTGNVLYIPTEDDTTTEAALIAEAAAVTVQDLTFGQKQLDAYKYATQMKVSWELMQDSAFNIDNEIRNAFGPRFGRAMNSSCTTGTGSSQPNGVVTASTLGKTAASATAITFAETVDLIHSVDPAYRRSKSCGFMLHDTVLAAVKKLSIGVNDARPLWQPSDRVGDPDRIDGYPYWINQGMASALTTGQKVMLFGDFNYYIIRLVQSLLVLRLNERYADNGLVGYIGYMRWDGECVNTAAIKHYILA